jgi:hypothetical protein
MPTPGVRSVVDTSRIQSPGQAAAAGRRSNLPPREESNGEASTAGLSVGRVCLDEAVGRTDPGYVVPVLRAAGFARKGRRFILGNEDGHLAFIQVSTSGKLAIGDGYRHFSAARWMAPKPFVEFAVARRISDPALYPSLGMRMRAIRPPLEFWKGHGVAPRRQTPSGISSRTTLTTTTPAAGLWPRGSDLR